MTNSRAYCAWPGLLVGGARRYACRQCWGLTYESRRENYKSSGWRRPKGNAERREILERQRVESSSPSRPNPSAVAAGLAPTRDVVSADTELTELHPPPQSAISAPSSGGHARTPRGRVAAGSNCLAGRSAPDGRRFDGLSVDAPDAPGSMILALRTPWGQGSNERPTESG
jgi:hypothetical protein